ncbi:MAG: C40 family peptidase [Blastococcus sp.]
MATPSPRAPRTVIRPTAGAARRGIVVLAGVVGILLSALPAQAAPTTAAEAAQLMAARSHDLEVLTEKFDTAGVRLAADEAVVKAATVKLQQATATLGRAQQEVRGIARSAFTGGSSPFQALMTSKNADDFVGKMTTLETIAGHQNAVLQVAADANLAAAQAQATARKAAAAARAQYKSLLAQQATLKAQVAQFQKDFSRLSAAEQRAVVAAPERASRADRPAPVATGPIVAGSQVAQIVVDTALAQRGKPYVWAAAGPDSFDCSGLVDYAFAAAGIGLPHSSLLQSQMGRPVSRSQLQPGDLVFFYSPVSHVGIYIGNGQMVHAPTTGDVVKVSDIDVMGYFAGARRIG